MELIPKAPLYRDYHGLRMQQRFELPYARTKKNYYEYVYPLINEIRIKSKDIAMEGPGEFNK